MISTGNVIMLQRGQAMNRLRFLLLAPVLAAALWLTLASDPTDVRLRQVRELCDRGAFGAVDDEQSKRLVAQVEHLVRITVPDTRVVVNGIPKRSVLNVYPWPQER